MLQKPETKWVNQFCRPGILLFLLIGIMPSFSAAYNLTSIGGMAVYAQDALNTIPSSVLWSDANKNFSSTVTSGANIGSGLIDTIRARANHERDEFAMGIRASDDDFYTQIWNGTGWGNNAEHTLTSQANDLVQSFDLAYEDVSGDLIIVYENATGNNNNLAYKTWDGSAYSSEMLYNFSASDEARNIRLIPKAGTDHAMLIFQTANSRLIASLWNGTGFGADTVITTAMSHAVIENFGFAWEGSSGDGLVVFGTGATGQVQYATFDSATGLWSVAANLLDMSGAQAVQNVEVCPDPSSDYIGFVVRDAGDDVEFGIWGGSALEASPARPGETITANPPGGNGQSNTACAWTQDGGTGLFAYVPAAAANDHNIAYLTYNKTAWSQNDLDNAATFAMDTANTDPLNNLNLFSSPLRNEIMAVSIHALGDSGGTQTVAAFWNTTGNFTIINPNPLSADVECAAATDCSQFAWELHDPNPDLNVTVLFNNTNFALNSTLTINATVTDNIGISQVVANISYPNGSVARLVMANITASLYNISFRTDLNGNYNFTITANDTSRHQNRNISSYTFFSMGDVNYPTGTNITPSGNTSFMRNDTVALRVNVTDDIAVSGVYANITMPNGTVWSERMNNITENTGVVTFEFNYSNTSMSGTYSLRYMINDSSNNRNATLTDTFGIEDSTVPSLSGLNPQNGTTFALNATVSINVTVTDNLAVSGAIAIIRMPNGSVETLFMANITASLFNASFYGTSSTGQYNLTIFANDTTNNTQPASGYFIAGDILAPNVGLDLPANNHNTTSGNITFSANITDNTASVSCSLLVNSALNQTNSTALNATTAYFAVTGIANGMHTWKVNCTDSTGNYNMTSARNFTVDGIKPSFDNITLAPNTEAGLDPGRLINFSIGISDNLTGVAEVILQYRISTNSTFTNISANLASGYYNASFIAADAGTYFYRAFARDFVNNSDFSNTLNLSAQADTTWERTPATLPTKGVGPSANFSLGNITINNTGDAPLNFTLSSTRSQTLFSRSFPVAINASGSATIEVNETSPASNGLVSFTIVIDASPNADPPQLNVPASFVVADDAFLTANFVSPISSAAQRDEGVEFTANVKNVGTKNAANVTIIFSIPADWSNASTLSSGLFELIEPNETESYSISIDIPANATTGARAVSVTATGYNLSGFDLSAKDFILGESVNVTVSAFTAFAAQAGAGETVSGAAAPAAAASSGTTSGGAVSRAPGGEIVYTTETLEIVRGKTKTIPVKVTNLYKNAVLKDISLEVQGFMSQHIGIKPLINYSAKVRVETKTLSLALNSPLLFNLTGIGNHMITATELAPGSAHVKLSSPEYELVLVKNVPVEIDLDNNGVADIELVLAGASEQAAEIEASRLGSPEYGKIHYLEEREYELSIFAPGYIEKQDSRLLVKITANIVAVNPQLAGFTSKELTEYRTLLFRVFEADPAEAADILAQARNDVKAMADAGIPVSKAQALLSEAESAAGMADYGEAIRLAVQISELKELAFEAQALLGEIRGGIGQARAHWLNLPETEKALALALKAFEREDFETALQRAKDAQLALVLETKGRVNILWFLSVYWWALVLGAIAILTGSFFAYKALAVRIINQRLKNLAREEVSISSLEKEAQEKHLKQGAMPAREYHRLMARYSARLEKIRLIRARLRNRRIGIIKTEQELENAKQEEEELFGYMKKLQADYLEKGALSREKFFEAYRADSERVAELEEEKEYLREKLEKEKAGRKYKLLSLVNNSYLGMRKLFEGKKAGNFEGEWVKITPEKIKSPGIAKEQETDEQKRLHAKETEQEGHSGPDKARHGLSQAEEAKKKREEVYKMLREHGIDAGERHE